ncbi:3-hydroxyacyl-CoA dehydrogenase family protein [Hymenobacter coccineus]|nr:3-hydroxyacyl-CoA dehydrogenase family protein [Hymenobacter coccineus]
MLINEAADALHRGVASRDDLEQAMTQGVNYPHGLLAWADALGPPRVLAWLDALYEEYHEERYRASPLLRKLARTNQLFIPHERVAQA